MTTFYEREYLERVIAEYLEELAELNKKSESRKKGSIAARKRAVTVYKLLQQTKKDLAEIV